MGRDGIFGGQTLGSLGLAAGERKVEAEDCNFRGLQSLDSEPAEMLLSLGVVVLGGTTGAGGCQAVMMSLARSSCRCVRM